MKISKSKRAKVVHVFLAASLAAMVAVLAVVVFWLYRPYNEITYSGNLVPSEEIVEQGGMISFSGKDFCNNGVTNKVTRVIRNESGAIFLLPLEFYAPAEKVCFDEYTVTVELPFDVPPGEWTFVTINSYNPNPTFRTVSVEIESLPFTIVGEGEGPSSKLS